jgi:iron-regulated transporter 1
VELDEQAPMQNSEKKAEPKKSCNCATMFKPIVVLVKGWKTYVGQKVFSAGLALALLCMTVMGFDSVTVGNLILEQSENLHLSTSFPLVGYIYGNGVSESTVGIMMALTGVTGILATFIYPCMRRKLGLEKTGVVAFSGELLCLVLAVVSIWLPGSVFDLNFEDKPASTNCTVLTTETTFSATRSTAMPFVTDGLEFASEAEGLADCVQTDGATKGPSVSIIVFLVGVIASRTGTRNPQNVTQIIPGINCTGTVIISYTSQIYSGIVMCLYK